MRRICLFVFVLAALAAPAFAQAIPRAAVPYRRALTANARLVWGLDAPVAVLASQVHQESGWRADAKSAYASGLAQFTPATADWISQKYASDLGVNQPLEPAWALRALAVYDKWLFDRQAAATPCDRWAFTLSAYNGGEGWVTRDKRKASAQGADTLRWWGQVERYSDRAAWAVTENREYPRRILLQRQTPYRAWGAGVDCEVA